MNKRAVLLLNLGSPENPDITSVRKYLNQFLMDPYVIAMPWLLRRLLVSLLILPTRPKHSAHAYQSVWTKQGSPLLALSEAMLEKLTNKVNIPVQLAMRYGKPSIESQLKALANQPGINEVLFIPLYPHYAESTVLTSIKEAYRVIKKEKLGLTLIIPPTFYQNKDYINALYSSAKPWLNPIEKVEHVLFSYHGLPEFHLTKADSTKQHCLKKENCCSTPSQAHSTCYRHQVMASTQALVTKAGLTPDQYSISFQSRLGRAKWLEPSTENTLVTLAEKGVKNLLVMCPAFVTDCLETLEEIEIQGKEIFIKAGGESLTLIPCLNDHPEWINTLATWINEDY